MLKYQIYGLFDPETKELRYVGFTTASLSHRLSQHLCDKSTSHKVSWIKSLKNKNLKPEIFLLQETDENNWEFDEEWNRQYFKSIGCKLTNLVRGGSKTMLGFKHSEKTKKRGRNKGLENVILLKRED